MQTRYTPAALLAKFGSSKKGGLDLPGLKRLFADFAPEPSGRLAIAQRVLRLWDTNNDAAISHAELEPLVSATDGQVSLGALDQAVGGTPLVKMVRATRGVRDGLVGNERGAGQLPQQG